MNYILPFRSSPDRQIDNWQKAMHKSLPAEIENVENDMVSYL